MTPQVCERDNGWLRPATYQVFVSVNGICYWLTKYGYVPPIRENVKFYTTFKKRDNAERAAQQPVKFLEASA